MERSFRGTVCRRYEGAGCRDEEKNKDTWADDSAVFLRQARSGMKWSGWRTRRLGSGNQQFYFGHGNFELQITHLASVQGRQLLRESTAQGQVEAGDTHLVITGVWTACQPRRLMGWTREWPWTQKRRVLAARLWLTPAAIHISFYRKKYFSHMAATLSRVCEYQRCRGGKRLSRTLLQTAQ